MLAVHVSHQMAIHAGGKPWEFTMIEHHKCTVWMYSWKKLEVVCGEVLSDPASGGVFVSNPRMPQCTEDIIWPHWNNTEFSKEKSEVQFPVVTVHITAFLISQNDYWTEIQCKTVRTNWIPPAVQHFTDDKSEIFNLYHLSSYQGSLGDAHKHIHVFAHTHLAKDSFLPAVSPSAFPLFNFTLNLGGSYGTAANQTHIREHLTTWTGAYLWGDGGREAVCIEHECVHISMNMLNSWSASVSTQEDIGEEPNLNNSNSY